MAQPPPQDRNDWLMLGIVALVASAAHILKVVSRGDPLNRNTAARVIARTALTGVVAAAVWSAISEFRTLNPATAVAVATSVAMLGVDYVERLLDKVVEQKLGVDVKTDEEMRVVQAPEPPTPEPAPTSPEPNDPVEVKKDV